MALDHSSQETNSSGQQFVPSSWAHLKESCENNQSIDLFTIGATWWST